MKHISKEAAVENLKKFFSNTPEDVISIRDVFIAWGRDPAQEARNKGWFSNKMVDMKYNNLLTPIYAMKNNRRTLVKVQLTLEGKRALRRIENALDPNGTVSPATNGNGGLPSVDDFMKMLAKLKKQNPDYEFTFNVKLKGE